MALKGNLRDFSTTQLLNLINLAAKAMLGKPLPAKAKDLWLNLLHIHGSDVMFDLFVDYPVQIINWHDRDTPPSLRGGQDRFSGVVCGGLQREKTMVFGTPDEVLAEARDAIQATGGERFILGTGCVVPVIAPHGNIHRLIYPVRHIDNVPPLYDNIVPQSSLRKSR